MEILDEIDKILAEKGFQNERQQLNDEQDASSTGSELYLRVGSKLLTLETTNKDFSRLVGHLVKEFIACCNKNGLYPTEFKELK